MDRENVRWLVAIVIGLAAFIAYGAGYSSAFWLLGLAAAIWIAYELWDGIGDFKEKRGRDKTRKHKEAYMRRHH